MNKEKNVRPLILRPVREEDYPHIQRISKDIWEGHDYLPKVFHTWLHEPGLFIGVQDPDTGEIVGVAHVALLYDGTAWLGGLRVRTDYQGQGISHLMIGAQMQYTIEKLRQGAIQRIACTTFIENKASQHLCLSYGLKLERSYLLLNWNKACKPSPLIIEPWEPSWEEIKALPYFNDTDQLILQFFKMQKINKDWWEHSKKDFQLFKVNGSRGWLDQSHENHCVILEPDFSSIHHWLQFASDRFGEDASTVILPKADLIEELKHSSLEVWSNWEPDCLYFVFEPST